MSSVRTPFVHQALLYGSEDEYVAGTLPVIREAQAAERPVLVVADAPNVAALRAALGAGDAGVAFEHRPGWYGGPAQTVAAFERWVREHDDGCGVSLIGEPVWSGLSEAGMREWMRAECAYNVAWADMRVRFVCPYDTRVVPERALQCAHCTHPEIVSAEAVRPSVDYRDPLRFFGELDGEPLAEPDASAPVLHLPVAGDTAAARRFVARHASAFGLAAERVEELVLAANELITNVQRHARGPGELRLWRHDDVLLCEVRDRGPGLGDPLVGHVRPSSASPGGFGVWIARHLCDLVEVRTGEAGTTVRLHLALA